jgi:DNA-binding NarL/FixJ family response regulator
LSKVSILVADDHEVVRTGVRQVLLACDDLEVADEAESGTEVLARLRTRAYGVILTDLAMPGPSGIDLIRRIKALQPEAVVLVHSMYVDGQTATRALHAGATGYVSKGSDASTLIEGVRQVAQGRKYISPDLVDEVLSNLSAGAVGLPHEQLSEREFEVFRLLIDGLSVGMVAERLALSPKTVSTHKIRLMHKLRVKSDTELIRYAIAHQLIH